jgi:hypothetical protein
MVQPGTIDAHLSFTFYRNHLKKVFSPDIGVEPSSQVLDILDMRVEDPVNRRCGLILGLVLISTENPNFEESSRFREKILIPHIRLAKIFPPTGQPPSTVNSCHPRHLPYKPQKIRRRLT